MLMATWTKKENRARIEAQRRWRAKNKPVVSKQKYWISRRFQNLVKAGIIVPEIVEEK